MESVGKNNTFHDYPKDRSIHSFFEDMAKTIPDNIAVEFEDKRITYRELNNLADRIASVLVSRGINAGKVAAVITERSVNMIAAILAVLKSGAAYLPIEPGIPDERKKYYLKTAEASVILSNADSKKLFDLPNINIDKLPDNSIPYIAASVPSENPAYIIFTSGSTGSPKGVMVRHYSVVNRLLWMKEQYGLSESDVFLQKTVYSFDVSVWELFLWFFCGARLCLLKSGDEGNFAKLINTIDLHDVTVCHFVPSILRVFVRYVSHRGISNLKSLKKVFVSGEALTYDLVCRFNQTLTMGNSTELHNLYGPTEATVDVTYFDCTNYCSENETVPIGCPIWNTKIYIIDENGRECADGSIGEICISGDGVAAGYVNNPELTRQFFVADIYDSNKKMYRTGDLGRWQNGVVEYMGRADNQVKVHGIRVELEEIESQLLKYAAINNAIVIAAGETDKKLVAYYNCGDGGVSTQLISDYLSEKLPKAMIPAEFIYIENIPLKQNGKADRKALELLYKNKQEAGYET